MGNCLCPETDGDTTMAAKPGAFQGQGHRLGTADEATRLSAPTGAGPMTRDDEPVPEPVYDANLTEGDRAQIRADRAAAAEARVKKQTGKKKPTKTSEPLRGPNSEPLMRWNA